MRIFAISDLHVDYAENERWVTQLSTWDYQQDVLICAGDVAHTTSDVAKALLALRNRFNSVVYLPGNHELWVKHEPGKTSLEKFQEIMRLAAESGVQTQPLHLKEVSLVPVLAWYDYSFGSPSSELLERWADFHVCIWPEHFDQARLTAHFLAQNSPFASEDDRKIISFSHFVPRNDLLPASGRTMDLLRPVMGSDAIDVYIRKLGSSMHIYGHYHVNRRSERDNILYINNALGYPSEHHISAKQLLCIYEPSA